MVKIKQQSTIGILHHMVRATSDNIDSLMRSLSSLKYQRNDDAIGWNINETMIAFTTNQPPFYMQQSTNGGHINDTTINKQPNAAIYEYEVQQSSTINHLLAIICINRYNNQPTAAIIYLCSKQPMEVIIDATINHPWPSYTCATNYQWRSS